MVLWITCTTMYPVVAEQVTMDGVKEKSPQEVIDDYIQSVGGVEKINEIKTLVTVMEAEIQGMSIEMSTSRDLEKKRLMQQTVMNGNVMQKTVVKDGEGYMSAMGQTQTLEGDQLETISTQLYAFPEIYYEDLGFELEMGEVEEIEGEQAYTLIVTTSQGLETKEYYSVETGLKLMISSEVAGDILFSNYEEVEGIKFPMKMSITNPMLPVPMEAEVIAVQINESLDDSLFQ
ncbi:peptidase, M16 family protein [Negadavirga shengliensis]|uniref:Peptidase, M16 family protein n=1 Tax=Negadavirga shengliensis TaxID=1389218 RepID=A0ABV9SX44_9BACT